MNDSTASSSNEQVNPSLRPKQKYHVKARYLRPRDDDWSLFELTLTCNHVSGVRRHAIMRIHRSTGVERNRIEVLSYETVNE